ncbi:ribbon-helix-helix domain-containing protein [Stratiformator vulcanicus]|uniref:Nickel responsive regulator n=1 Tax=Stratiformator vulcanicus TaxID=2527980 RepID=A0A517R6C2_9PLAN|nr:type II toxin-antitoxin system ParD family antitoxin [Stratiformator vulcanicus]QDT39434.1 nickel responsive regulator [Stratiformator vulcanicus]
MSRITIEISDELVEHLEERASSKGFGSASEYLQEIIRDDRRQAAFQRVEQLLLEGLDSGPPKELLPEDWDALRSRLASKHGQPVPPRSAVG